MNILRREVRHTLIQWCVGIDSYDSRVKKQYVRILYETNKLKLFNGIHEIFLKAIDHMEFHPTLGKEKKGTSFKLHKHIVENMDASMAHQLKYMSPDDIEMLRKGNEIIQERYLSLNNTKHWTKRFGFGYLDFVLGNIQ